MNALLIVIPCLLASMACGFLLGSTLRSQREKETAAEERSKTIRVLNNLLAAIEQTNTDVTQHSSVVREVEQNLSGMEVDGELQVMQQALLQQVTTVLSANQQLTDDLNCTRLKAEEQAVEIDRVRQEARCDALSGVGNRAAFDERLQLMLSLWRRQHVSFVLVLADVDHFKWINDGHGHQAGDGVIRRLGELLRSSVRDVDFVARYGGDEFAILLAGATRETGALFTERLRHRISCSNFDLEKDGQRLAVTFSIGMASVWDGAAAETLFARADRALYQSKNSGRNSSHCCDDELVVSTAGMVE